MSRRERKKGGEVVRRGEQGGREVEKRKKEGENKLSFNEMMMMSALY